MRRGQAEAKFAYRRCRIRNAEKALDPVCADAADRAMFGGNDRVVHGRRLTWRGSPARKKNVPRRSFDLPLPLRHPCL
jgi:hypothetical protein